MTAPGLGRPIDYGATGVAKRLAAMAGVARLRGERLLDVGCGNGAYTEHLARTFGEVVAIDVVPEHLEDFGSRLPENVTTRLLSADDLDYPDGHFDVAVMIEVVEHLADPVRSLAQIRRVLREGGQLVITAPNRWFPVETHLVKIRGRAFPGRYMPFLPWLPPLHTRIADARIYTLGSLRAAVEPAGFRLCGADWIMPPFDGWNVGRRFVKPVTDVIERTPLRRFGVSVVATFEAVG